MHLLGNHQNHTLFLERSIFASFPLSCGTLIKSGVQHYGHRKKEQISAHATHLNCICWECFQFSTILSGSSPLSTVNSSSRMLISSLIGDEYIT